MKQKTKLTCDECKKEYNTYEDESGSVDIYWEEKYDTYFLICDACRIKNVEKVIKSVGGKLK